VAWIITNHKKKRSIFIPSLVAAFVFNAANIYLIIFGNNIPSWIYLIIGATTLISSYFSIVKIRNKMHKSD